jgi:hypothetical protein
LVLDYTPNIRTTPLVLLYIYFLYFPLSIPKNLKEKNDCNPFMLCPFFWHYGINDFPLCPLVFLSNFFAEFGIIGFFPICPQTQWPGHSYDHPPVSLIFYPNPLNHSELITFFLVGNLQLHLSKNKYYYNSFIKNNTTL